MKSYLIVSTNEDTTDALYVVGDFDTRDEATKFAKDLTPGTYSLLSVLRPNFVVRESMKVVRQVVDWGTTAKPRVRKPRAEGEAKPKRKSKSKHTNGSLPVGAEYVS